MPERCGLEIPEQCLTCPELLRKLELVEMTSVYSAESHFKELDTSSGIYLSNHNLEIMYGRSLSRRILDRREELAEWLDPNCMGTSVTRRFVFLRKTECNNPSM